MAEEANRYREVLDGLARSRGLSGADELAERAAKLSRSAPGRRYTRKELLTGSRGGFGTALDRVLGLEEAEMKMLTRAWMDTHDRPAHGLASKA